MVPVTSRTTKLFLGLRTQCVQCHDHPFNGEWKQQHFWGINAFFRQPTRRAAGPAMMAAEEAKASRKASASCVDDTDLNTKGMVPYERRNAAVYFTKATFLDGKQMPEDAQRQRAARSWPSSSPTAPYFAKAFVNRMWRHFFGKSFTKDAPDDFGEHNPSRIPSCSTGSPRTGPRSTTTTPRTWSAGSATAGPTACRASPTRATTSRRTRSSSPACCSSR